MRRQKRRDGSWGSGGRIDRLVSTCHAVMALLDSGYPANHPVVAKGIEWLTSGEPARHPWSFSFWRVSPLLNIEGYSEVVESDILRIDDAIARRISPDPDQILEIIQLMFLTILGYSDRRIDTYLRTILNEWTEEEAWRNRADTTSHALSAIDPFDFPDKRRIFDASKRFIALKADVDGHFAHWGGGIASTSYIVMNICESTLAEDSTLYKLAQKAVNWLEYICKPGGFWPPDAVPPYGGNVTSPEYFTSLAIRAIISLRSTENIFFPLAIARQREYELTRKLRLRTYAGLFAMAALVAAFAYSLRGIATELTSVPWFATAIAGTFMILGAVASVLAIYEFVSRR